MESSAQGETDTLKKNAEREKKMKAAAREASLQTVVDDLCEQHERQEDMEEASYRCSYPSKFPDWERAWEQAGEVRYGVSDSDAAALLERLEKAEGQVVHLLAAATEVREALMTLPLERRVDDIITGYQKESLLKALAKLDEARCGYCVDEHGRGRPDRDRG